LWKDSESGRFLRKLKTNIESAYNYLKESKEELISSIEVIEKDDIYYFKKSKQKFYKISLYNPDTIEIIAKILTSGCILEHKFDVYEVHTLTNIDTLKLSTQIPQRL